MVRAGRDFTDREMEFVAAVAPAIATATSLAVCLEARGWTPGGHPAIVVVGPRGELRDYPCRTGVAGPARRDRTRPVHGDDAGNGCRCCSPGKPADRRGRRPGRGHDRASNRRSADRLLLAAYGLTSRERDICREVIAGHSTADIITESTRRLATAGLGTLATTPSTPLP
jgi:hypothetical protein